MSLSPLSVVLVACCLAVAAPPVSAADNIGRSAPSVTSTVDALAPAVPVPAAVGVIVDPAGKAIPPVVCESVPDYVAAEYFWYMRAMLTLNCVDAIAERELKLSGSDHEQPGSTVTIPRDVLERLRELALVAKDAAARIGR